jgi:hypothetical protein
VIALSGIAAWRRRTAPEAPPAPLNVPEPGAGA